MGFFWVFIYFVRLPSAERPSFGTPQKKAKMLHSFSPTQSVSAKAVVARFSPQRQLNISVTSSATNKRSSIVRRSAVKTAQCGSPNCREQVQLGRSMLDYIVVHRRLFQLTEKGFALNQNVRGKPPTAKERHQRRAIVQNKMKDFVKF